MGSSKPKPAICWGLFPIMGIPHMVEKGHSLESSSYVRMKVTSFKRNPRTQKVFAYGALLPVLVTTSHCVDGMFFYESEKAMEDAVKRMSKIEPDLNQQVRDAMQKSYDVQRGRRIILEQELGKHAVMPLELENL